MVAFLADHYRVCEVRRNQSAKCLLSLTQLLDAPESQKLFPPDVLKRAKEYLDATGSGGTGAYTHSQGVEVCREHVAKVNMTLLLDLEFFF